MTKIISLIVLMFSFQVMAQGSTKVQCAQQNDHSFFITITVNQENKIIKASNNKLLEADHNSNSPYALLAMDLSVAPFESMNTFSASNGFSILRVVTTAEVISVGISPDLQRGFFAYQDIGSGNGNSSANLVCRRL